MRFSLFTLVVRSDPNTSFYSLLTSRFVSKDLLLTLRSFVRHKTFCLSVLTFLFFRCGSEKTKFTVHGLQKGVSSVAMRSKVY